MFRVITTYRTGGPYPVVEKGPWHPDRQNAETWADRLRTLGYVVRIESQFNAISEDNSSLADALASMA